MRTDHRILIRDARKMDELGDESVDLVVTSPPYPMIAMWDGLFSALHVEIGEALEQEDGRRAFALMHRELDRVWHELWRVLKPGAFACINIGDAVRTLGGRFQLFANHTRIQQKIFELGFDLLPLILWRKQTNAPNKFMGSGMLPAGAYVTLEHEYILIVRKGDKRVFSTAGEKLRRMRSALFWQERNNWYGDLWDFKGVRQQTGKEELRKRSAAFPFLLPFRLINMYSQAGDAVLDPFLGTGTTVLAAMACGRGSVAYELDGSFARPLREKILNGFFSLNKYNYDRLTGQLDFVNRCSEENRPLKHFNAFYRFPVITKQETQLRLLFLENVEEVEANRYRATHTHGDGFPAPFKDRKTGADGLCQQALFVLPL